LKNYPTNNSSACYAGIQDWNSAITDAKECIRLEPSFVKGYYRLALAQLESSDIPSAIATIQQGLQIDPRNGPLTKQLQLAKQKQQLQQQRRRRAASTNATAQPSILPNLSTANAELMELQQSYIQTLRELKLVETNIRQSQRELQSHTLTQQELNDPALMDSTTTMYRAVGKMFLRSTRSDVLQHLDTSISIERTRQEEDTNKQTYLERKLQSIQQNIRELSQQHQPQVTAAAATTKTTAVIAT
jgi:stress-induced-phosphoprotein 1